jgi:hypothetical protein
VIAESTLVASVYLFSGKLPLQVNPKVVVSSWHNIELLEQIGFLIAQLRETAKLPEYSREVKRGLTRLELLSELLVSPDQKQFRKALTTSEATARQDDDLLKGQGVSLEQRIEIFAVRAICSLLAQDRYTEPLDQLRRLMSGAVAGFATHSDVEHLRLTTPEDDGLFEAAKADWMKRLRRADQAVQHRLDRSPRAEASIVHDASTLAWLDVLTQRQAKSGKRLTFVTGDRVLLNACRRRNAEDPSRPFFVRSVQHFAPIFNLNDADSTLRTSGNAPSHFLRIRQSLEQSLAFLNVSLDDHDAAGRPLPQAIRGRDTFLVDAEERDGDIFQAHHFKLFRQFFDQAWVTQKEAELDAIAKPVQDLERLAISSFRDKVIARVESNGALKLLKEWRASESAEALGPIIERVIEKLIDDVSEATLDFAVKSAPDFLAILRAEPSKLFKRAVYRMRLRFPIGDGREVEAADYVEQLVRDDLHVAAAKVELLRDRPELLLALGTILAFRSERWSLAASIAELALGACADAPLEVRGEIEYARAVALRYRLASVLPSPQASTQDVWLRWLRSAQAALTTSLEHFPAAEHPLWHIRSRAERAAVALAYLEWVAYARLDRLPGHRLEGAQYVRDVETLLQEAVDDLRACRQLSLDFALSVATPAADQAADLQALRDHWQWNMLVADLTSRKLAEASLLPANGKTALADGELMETLSAQPRQHLIYDVYWRSLTGEIDETEARKISRRIRQDFTLALDRAVALDLVKPFAPPPKPRK